MAKSKKQHQPILLPESNSKKPVRMPWLWISLLVIGALLTFWREFMFDASEVQKQQIEAQKELDQEMNQNKLTRDLLKKQYPINQKFDEK